jgi:formimidoylglutamate deiminase
MARVLFAAGGFTPTNSSAAKGSRVTELHFSHALLPEGWARDVLIRVEGTRIAAVAPASPPGDAERHAGIAVPGLANLHSHAFQRAMAGLAEIGGPEADTFWTWREVMYRFLATLTPDAVEAIAAALYAEMLESGFTAVAEFHYLHHAPDGRPYDDLGEMAARIVAAAASAGIGLTLLPTLYSQGGFGGAPPHDGQRRFLNDRTRYLALVDRTRALARAWPDTVVGIAPHSLRAVDPQDLAAVVAATPAGPIHIHAAEQQREVDDCLAWSGERPVEWLLGRHEVGPRWCLVHATHMTPLETAALARSRAVAGLCPITEGNLGDGLFDLVRFVDEGGRLGIGTDSNILVSPPEELRLLEYGQRLSRQARNVIAAPGASSGRGLFDRARRGGAQALGRNPDGLMPGAPADIVVLDATHPALLGRTGDAWLDGWIFASDRGVVRDVWAGGRHVVVEGRHRARDTLRAGYAAALRDMVGA